MYEDENTTGRVLVGMYEDENTTGRVLVGMYEDETPQAGYWWACMRMKHHRQGIGGHV